MSPILLTVTVLSYIYSPALNNRNPNKIKVIYKVRIKRMTFNHWKKIIDKIDDFL